MKIGDRVVYRPREPGLNETGAHGTLTFVFKESKHFAGRVRWDTPKNPYQTDWDDLVYHDEIEILDDN